MSPLSVQTVFDDVEIIDYRDHHTPSGSKYKPGSGIKDLAESPVCCRHFNAARV